MLPTSQEDPKRLESRPQVRLTDADETFGAAATAASTVSDALGEARVCDALGVDTAFG